MTNPGEKRTYVNPIKPNIHIQILQTDLHTSPLRISWENLIKDHGIFSMVIILLILITLSLDSVWILLGENWCWTLLGLKWLISKCISLVPTEKPYYREIMASISLLTCKPQFFMDSFLIEDALCPWLSPITFSVFFVKNGDSEPEIYPSKKIIEKNCYCCAVHWIIFRSMVGRLAWRPLK